MIPPLLLLLLLSLAAPPPAALVSARRVNLAVDPSEQPESPDGSANSLANASLSPWTYRESFQSNRLPSRIFQAECSTSGCLSLQGGGEDAALEAKPIQYQVLVLHRVWRKTNKKRRSYKFRLGTEMITVGCTCVRPCVIPQQ